MTLQEVNTAATRKLFLDINVIINGNDPDYIQPLDKDIQLVFDPKLNKTFRHGEATRWVLIDKNGKGIGRIAAFVNKKYKTKNDHGPIGGIGFFDCIHNQE